MASVSDSHADVLCHSFIRHFWSVIPVGFVQLKVVFRKDCLGFEKSHLRLAPLASFICGRCHLGRLLCRCRHRRRLFNVVVNFYK